MLNTSRIRLWCALVPLLCLAWHSVAAEESLRIALQNRMPHTPLFVAVERGYFERQGIDVELRMLSADDDLYDLIDMGEIELAALTSLEILDYRDTGLDLGGALILGSSQEAEALITAGDSDVASIRDLRNRRVAVRRGSAGELLLKLLLQRKGLELDDVQTVNLAAEDAVSALLAGEVDASLTHAPFWPDDDTIRIIASAREQPGLVMDLLSGDSRYLESNRPLIKGVIRAWNDAVNYLRRNPARAEQIIAESINLEPPAVASALQGIELYNVDDNMQLLRGEFQQAFADMGNVLENTRSRAATSYPSANSILVLSPLRQVAADR